MCEFWLLLKSNHSITFVVSLVAQTLTNSHGHVDIVYSLIDNGADVSLSNSSGENSYCYRSYLFLFGLVLVGVFTMFHGLADCLKL